MSQAIAVKFYKTDTSAKKKLSSSERIFVVFKDTIESVKSFSVGDILV